VDQPRLGAIRKFFAKKNRAAADRLGAGISVGPTKQVILYAILGGKKIGGAM